MRTVPHLRRSGWTFGGASCAEGMKQRVADTIGADLVDSADYEPTALPSGLPRGGLDFIYGDACPHETNMDHLLTRRVRSRAALSARRWCPRMHLAARAQAAPFARDSRLTPARTRPAILAGRQAVRHHGPRLPAANVAGAYPDRSVSDALSAALGLSAGGFAIRSPTPGELQPAANKTRRMSRPRAVPTGEPMPHGLGEDPFYVAYHDNQNGAFLPEYDYRALYDKADPRRLPGRLSGSRGLRKRDNFLPRSVPCDFRPERSRA